MIRLIGILLMIAGVVIGFVWPSLVTRHSGAMLGEAIVFERGFGWRPAAFELATSDNPFRIQIVGEYLPGAQHGQTAMPLRLRLAGPDGQVLRETVRLPLPERPSGQQTVETVIETAAFSIEGAGLHQLTINAGGRQDRNLAKAKVVLRGGVGTVGATYRQPAYALIGLGFVVLLFSGYGRRLVRRRPKSETATEPARPKRRWGREGSQDG